MASEVLAKERGLVLVFDSGVNVGEEVLEVANLTSQLVVLESFKVNGEVFKPLGIVVAPQSSSKFWLENMSALPKEPFHLAIDVIADESGEASFELSGNVSVSKSEADWWFVRKA